MLLGKVWNKLVALPKKGCDIEWQLDTGGQVVHGNWIAPATKFTEWHPSQFRDDVTVNIDASAVAVGPKTVPGTTVLT